MYIGSTEASALPQNNKQTNNKNVGVDDSVDPKFMLFYGRTRGSAPTNIFKNNCSGRRLCRPVIVINGKG